jgi:hypothetical protein
MNYLCLRCGYETEYKTNMKSHLDRIIKCTKNINVIDKNDKELYNLSLKPNKKNEKKYYCKRCDKSYSRIDSYQRHIKNNKECNENNKEYNENIEKVKIIETKINNISNISNSNITCCDTINNINVYILPFDNNWTTEHLNNKERTYIVSSLMKYTTLLNELLENDKNLNVIVEENTNEALVFKNEKDKYVNIKKRDLYSKTMEELKNILIEMTNNIITSPNGSETNYSNNLKNHLEREVKEIIKKYNDYKENNEIRNNANNSLEQVFINKKNDAEIIAKKIINIEGY